MNILVFTLELCLESLGGDINSLAVPLASHLVHLCLLNGSLQALVCQRKSLYLANYICFLSQGTFKVTLQDLNALSKVRGLVISGGIVT